MRGHSRAFDAEILVGREARALLFLSSRLLNDLRGCPGQNLAANRREREAGLGDVSRFRYCVHNKDKDGIQTRCDLDGPPVAIRDFGPARLKPRIEAHVLLAAEGGHRQRASPALVGDLDRVAGLSAAESQNSRALQHAQALSTPVARRTCRQEPIATHHEALLHTPHKDLRPRSTFHHYRATFREGPASGQGPHCRSFFLRSAAALQSCTPRGSQASVC